ncbi:MAG TPA: metallophosphoesterase [Allosphingosinicella sp.]|nr:metallophosphoesterase [Allosphingosinicella sp.]
MASLVQLSDVHFGAHDPKVVQGVEDFLLARRPDLVVVSGDFTQRARVSQYREAGEFLDRLEQGGLATLGVPGNHDVPFYDVVRRFVRPLHRYKKYIDDDLCPWFENDTLAVLGINTARSLTFKEGRISHAQMDLIRARFRDVAEAKTRILVTHHPLFALPIGEGEGLTKTVGRHEGALQAVADAGVQMVLAGHYHRSFSRSARDMVEKAGRELVIQAGTATSTRLRDGETQSFNWIDVPRPGAVELRVYGWTGEAFTAGTPAGFAFEDERWATYEPQPA